jgi:hypothetical protein
MIYPGFAAHDRLDAPDFVSGVRLVDWNREIP